MKIRRVVTGHDADGAAIVVRDGEMDNLKVMKSGNSGVLVWVTDETPPRVEGDDDPANREMGIAPPKGGSAFRILEVPPGKDAFMHCTDTIDYCIVMRGECVMLLDGGAEVAMRAGDVMVQRGTWHGWANRSDEPVRLAFVLISAQPPAQRLHDAL
jgi:uncharacterized cupin superfamily protein